MRREERFIHRPLRFQQPLRRALSRLVGKLRPERANGIPALLRIARLRVAARFGAKLSRLATGGLRLLRQLRWPTALSIRAWRARQTWSGLVGCALTLPPAGQLHASFTAHGPGGFHIASGEIPTKFNDIVLTNGSAHPRILAATVLGECTPTHWADTSARSPGADPSSMRETSASYSPAVDAVGDHAAGRIPRGTPSDLAGAPP
jgi:hypothetical protein